MARAAFLDGYESVGALNPPLLERCRTLAKLRLACIHSEPQLLALSDAPALAGRWAR